MPITEITRAKVLEVLEPIWHSKTETASRVRGRIEAVIGYAMVKEYRPYEQNPAAWKNNLSHCLASPEKLTASPDGEERHQPALPCDKIQDFLKELRTHDKIHAKAVELIILTAVRKDEARLARWQEFDFAKAIWTIPASRMKGKAGYRKAHRVPPSGAAIALLNSIRPDDAKPTDFVFADATGQAVCTRNLWYLTKTIDKTITVHGFRSTFREWCSQPAKDGDTASRVATETAETCLAHVVGNKVGRAYDRGDRLDLRRPVMEAWGHYCNGTTADNIV